MGYTGQTPAMLAASLDRQLRYLKKSARDYDAGDPDEGPRMATALRVLFHDTGSSHSLMKQIGLKEDVGYIDTSLANTTVYVNQPNIQLEYELQDGSTAFASMGQDGLADIYMEGTVNYYVASLREVPNRTYRLSFDKWWSDEIMDLPGGHRYSRKRLILAMANTDGGAHIDPRGVAVEYQDFATKGFIGWNGQRPVKASPGYEVTMDDNGVPLSGDAATPSIRQMVFETLESFKQSPELQAWLTANR